MSFSREYVGEADALHSESVSLRRYPFGTKVYLQLNLETPGTVVPYIALTPKQARKLAKKLRKAAGK